MRTRTQLSATILVLLVGVAGLVAQEKSNVTIKKVPAPHISPAFGQEMYLNYCASCHGKSGRGDGPAAPALKESVPNLTALSKQNQGVFPAAHVSTIIAGGDGAAHGSPDMPVWGPIFRSLHPGDEAQVQQRVANLTKYLESLQGK